MPDKSDHAADPDSDVLRHHIPRRLRLIGIVLLCLVMLTVVIGITLRLWNGHKTRAWTDDQAVQTVQLVTLKGSAGGDFTLPGDIEAFTNAPIYAQVSGYIQKWYFDIGTRVTAGALLAQIDPRPYQAALDQAKGQLAKDQAALAGAQKDLERYQALMAVNAIARQTVDDQAATVGTDKGIVESDQAAVETAQVNLGYTRVIAPFDGIVTSRTVDVGNLVTVGNTVTPGSSAATPLFTITDETRLRIYVHIPQSYSELIQPGMTTTFIVPEHPGRIFTATLVATADAIVTQSGTQLVQFQIDNSDHALKPGDYAQMNFGTGHTTHAISVPSTALLFREQGMLVATVGPGNKVQIKPVHISTDYGATVDVDTGLKGGDKVIDNPADTLHTGDVVKVAPPAPAI